MLNNRPFVIDTFAESYRELKHWSTDHFWEFEGYNPPLGAVVMFGRNQFLKHSARIRDLAESNHILPILDNPTEGSITIKTHLTSTKLHDLALNKKLLLISGGQLDADIPHLLYETFLAKPFEYTENVEQSLRSSEIYNKFGKPYKFLFLNGRIRTHRKYLLERFRMSGLLDQCIWSNLDATRVHDSQHWLSLIVDSQNLIPTPTPVKLLDPQYECEMHHKGLAKNPANNFVKSVLFDNLWGEIYIRAEPYIDTYFSLVTETVFNYPYSFRTEKIWKPIAMAHPWIAVANYGFYQDMRNLGFKTFSGLIDESFDTMQNDQQRIERITAVVEDLCQQDLDKFLVAAQDICKYNQQHMAELGPKIRQEFPDRFLNFVTQYINE